MHSVRRATLRLANGSRVAAAVAAPRPALASLASSSMPRHILLKPAAIQRAFSLTRTLANFDAADQVPSEEAAQETQVDDAGHEAEFAATGPAPGAGASTIDGPETPHGLFVRNLVFAATEQHLLEAFEKYGQISRAVVARDARGLSKGYGFIYFNSGEDMMKAASGANGSFWHGRRIQAAPRVKNEGGGGFAGSREENKKPIDERSPTNSIYVGNIPYETTDQELNKLFRSLENVTDVRIAVDRSTGWPRGFAHADFADVQSAVNAAKKLEGYALMGRNLRVDFSSFSKNYLMKKGDK